MTGEARRALEQFLRTDPNDAGCAQAVATLHVYAEIAASGADPEASYPGISAHLRACAPCFDDAEGLLLTVRETDGR
jgi:hypothetical protein